MEITDVKIFKANRRGPKLAYANVILDNQFIIRRITLIEKENTGRYISMPAVRLRNEERRTFRDVCHPLNSEVREKITDAVFKSYDEFMENEKKIEE